MRAIDVRIQGSWLRRRGLRGRWITVYVHRYGGQESTERLHSRPWVVAFGVVLRGRLLEVGGAEGSSPRRRDFLSLGMYQRGTLHRIEDGDAVTVFVGLLRTQARIERAAEVRTAEGVLPLHGDHAGLRGGRKHGARESTAASANIGSP